MTLANEIASDLRIDALRDTMVVSGSPRVTKDYFDPTNRCIGNSVQVFFKDGTSAEKVFIDYPIGHRRRRVEGVQVLLRKFESAVRGQLLSHQVNAILAATKGAEMLDAMPLDHFLALFTL